MTTPSPNNNGLDDTAQNGEAKHPQLRVVVVDDHSLFRRGVIDAIKDKVNVVGEADDIKSGIDVIRQHQPDVAIIDVQLPSGSGARIIEALLQGSVDPERTRFLGLSVSEEPTDVLELVRSGARGYVTKRIQGDDLVATIEQVAAGNAVFSPRLAGVVLNELSGKTTTTVPASSGAAESDDPEMQSLSPREREVLQLLARGYTYKEIGVELHISARTVESHTSSVLRKLQLSNRHALTHWAVRHNMI